MSDPMHTHDHPHPHEHQHVHAHPHTHEHGHVHAYDHHHHDEEDAYYLDQLCMIGLCGAFGAICLALIFWQTSMLDLMLAPQFYPFVLASGIALIVLAVLRGVVLWITVGQAPAPSGHAHDHGHHDHAHDHDHHDHGAEDHDHGWAPWRYVVLLVPVILFLLGLPNKPLQAPAMDVNLFRDTSEETFQAARFASLGIDGHARLALLVALFEEKNTLVYQQNPNNAKGVDFKILEQMSLNEDSRTRWKNAVVQVLGQFSPAKNSDKKFNLVRQRIQCCGADAVFLRVPIFANESINHVQRDAWVRVIGRVGFAPDGKDYVTTLTVPGRGAVLPSNPDPSFYVR